MQSLFLDGCEVDLERGEVVRGEARVTLTTRELELLAYLAARPGVAVSRAQLLREVWGFRGRIPDSRAPDFTVLRLRAKIEREPEVPRHVITVHGVGYRFAASRPTGRPAPGTAGGAPAEAEPTARDLPPPTLRWAPGHLVGREAERRTAAALLAQPGAPVVVQGPAGMGKTWLLREIDAAGAPNDRTVWLDLRHLDRTTLADGPRFLSRLHTELTEALGEEADSPEPAPSGAGALTRTLEQLGLARAEGQLRLVLDHADHAQHMGDPSVLYALLRSWCERVRSPWERFRLMLAVSTEPALLVAEPHLSPFNLSPPIVLGGLCGDEVVRLALRYGLPLTRAHEDALREWTDGHPALLRAALFAGASDRDGLDGALARSTDDGGCFRPYLDRHARALHANPGLRATLLDIGAGRLDGVDASSARRLDEAGLVCWRDRGWRLRSRLVATLLERL